MAVEYVQHNSTTTGNDASGDTLTVTLTSVVAGNLIIVAVARAELYTQAITVTDDNGNTYETAVENDAATGRQSNIYYAKNTASGTTLISVVCGANSRFAITAIEASGASVTDPLHSYSEWDDEADTSTRHCAAAAGFNPPADSIIIACSVSNTSTGAVTVGAGYTDLDSDGSIPAHMVAYREVSSPLTNERATYTYTGSRKGAGAVAAFYAGTTPRTRRRQSAGVPI